MMKQSLEKQLSFGQGVTTITPDPTRANPRRNCTYNGKSPGNLVVEVATSKGTINLTEGTNKN